MYAFGTWNSVRPRTTWSFPGENTPFTKWGSIWMELEPVPSKAMRFPSQLIDGSHAALWARTPWKDSKPAMSGPARKHDQSDRQKGYRIQQGLTFPFVDHAGAIQQDVASGVRMNAVPEEIDVPLVSSVPRTYSEPGGWHNIFPVLRPIWPRSPSCSVAHIAAGCISRRT